MTNHQDHANFIWQIADILRGPYRPPQYERVMLPMTVLRRFDCVLEASKEKVVAEYEKRKGGKIEGDALDKILNNTAGYSFHNRSPLTFAKLKGDPDNIDKHLASYIQGFSENVRKIFERFEFEKEILYLKEHNILYLVISRLCDIDLHPNVVTNEEMGGIFENLIRRFNEQANETAGDYFTPRDVIRLMVDMLIRDDDDFLQRPGTVRKMLDPACGTGGMLHEAQKHMDEHNLDANLFVFGQDFNPRAYAVAASDLLMKGSAQSRIEFGDSFLDDKFHGEKFDYLIANPPFGVDWKKQQKFIEREHETQGFSGRFGAGLPRVNDGALLFLLHMISKFEMVDEAKGKTGSRLAIVLNGSPLFTGGPTSGESAIRKWIIENDWLEAIVALPEQMFYNTGIGTYIWIVTNNKEPKRKGKIQLIDARERWQGMRRSLGDKRREISQSEETVREYSAFGSSVTSKIFDNADFGYTRVTVERPLRLRFEITTDRKARFLDAFPGLLADFQAIEKELGKSTYADWNFVSDKIQRLLKARGSKWKANAEKAFREVFTEKHPDAAPVVKSKKAGKTEYEADSALRDVENIPLKTNIDQYFKDEVLPHVADAWMDREKDQIGYEINFNRHFYTYKPPRPLAEIDADLKASEERIKKLLAEVTA